jgi:hypothetical protein
MLAQTWEVRISGQVPHAALIELGALGLSESPTHTVLTTVPLDQAGLHGVLDRIENLGLEIIELRALPATDSMDSE